MSPVPPACPRALGAPGSSMKPAVRRPQHHPDLKPLIRMEVNCQPMLRAGTRTAPAAGQGKLKVDEPQSSRLCNCSISSEQVLHRATLRLPGSFPFVTGPITCSQLAPTLMPGAGATHGSWDLSGAGASLHKGCGDKKPLGGPTVAASPFPLGNLTGNTSAGWVQRAFGQVSAKPR